jgi:hypothetical protein
MTLGKKPLLPITLMAIALTLSACSGVKPSLTAARPGEVAFRTGMKQEVSSINIPIEASADDISKALNRTLGKQLYQGSAKIKGLSVTVLRNGAIAVSAADNYIYFTVPVSLSLSYGMFGTPPVPVKLKFKASAKITPDWKLATEIYYLGLSDLFTEEVGIGPISLKPRSIVEGITQPLQQVLSNMVAKNINEIIPLKSQIATVWNAAQKPILIDKGYHAWLKLTPREVTFFPLQAQNNRVTLSVGITSFAEMVVGPEPAARPLTPLPPLKLVNTLDRSFRVALNADLFYQDIINIASPLLLNKEFSSDGKTIVLKSMELYGNGEKFVIRVETQGALDGVFYLTGKPHFDSSTNIFSVEDVDFDLQSQSLLLQSADWFLHGTIKSKIQEKLNMNLTQRLEQSREMAAKAIAQRQLVDHVLLKGNIKNLKFSDVLVQKDKISIQVYTEGESAVVFQ